ncbi:hypothetical protein ACIRBZ_44240 [Streptomyces sp. NPDC094038]|uniref:hypothetical protein n=1 Tax=Streptomyces sp. NPDC094038 TaxID=3366055 RepID=UPI003812108E
MFGKRLIASGAIAIPIGTLGSGGSDGNGSGNGNGVDNGVTHGQDDTGTGTGTGTGSGSGSGSGGTASAQDDTVHGLKESVRHITPKTTRATRPRLVKRPRPATGRYDCRCPARANAA